MKLKLLYFIFLIFIVTFTTNCSKNDDDEVARQITDIENFLKKNNITYKIENGVYKTTYFFSGSKMWAEPGDSVSFSFAEYVFQGGIGHYVYTNQREVAEVEKADLTLLDLTPRKVKLGSGGVMKSLSDGLAMSAVGDSVLLLIPSNLAYGMQTVEAVPKNTAVAFFVVINNVVKSK